MGLGPFAGRAKGNFPSRRRFRFPLVAKGSDPNGRLHKNRNLGFYRRHVYRRFGRQQHGIHRLSALFTNHVRVTGALRMAHLTQLEAALLITSAMLMVGGLMAAIG